MKVKNTQVVREIAWTAYRAEKKRGVLSIFALRLWPRRVQATGRH